MKYCPECGAKIEKEDLFCTGCGNKLIHKNISEVSHQKEKPKEPKIEYAKIDFDMVKIKKNLILGISIFIVIMFGCAILHALEMPYYENWNFIKSTSYWMVALSLAGIFLMIYYKAKNYNKRSYVIPSVFICGTLLNAITIGLACSGGGCRYYNWLSTVLQMHLIIVGVTSFIIFCESLYELFKDWE